MKVKGIISTIFFGLMAMTAISSLIGVIAMVMLWLFGSTDNMINFGKTIIITVVVCVVSFAIWMYGEKHCNKDDDEIFKDGGGSKFDL